MTKQVSNENEINSLWIRVNGKTKCILDCSSFYGEILWKQEVMATKFT